MRLAIVLVFWFSTILLNASERRALWVVRDALQSKASINQVISTAASSNITDIFVQVRALGTCYYPSQYEPLSKFIRPGFDPLRRITEKANRNNIRVHAWINCLYVWTGNELPSQNNHIFNIATNSILRKSKDSQGVLPDYKSLRNAGLEGYFQDPSDETVRNRLTLIVKEIIDNYNVQGIHLDYFRYPGYAYSFSPSGRTHYRLQEHTDPVTFLANPEDTIDLYGKNTYLSVSKNYRSFLQNNLTQLLQEIRNSIQQHNKNIELSVAVKPNAIIARNRYFQDWLGWLKAGMINHAVLMNYRTDWQEFKDNLMATVVASHHDSIIVGISTYNQEPAAVRSRMAYVGENGWAGYALFSYNHLIGNKEFLYRLKLYENFGGDNGL